MAPRWGHQKRPGSLASTPPVLGFVYDRSGHLHTLKIYFPKHMCLLSSCRKNTTQRWCCVWRSHWHRKYPGKTWYHLVSAPFSESPVHRTFQEQNTGWLCINTWKIVKPSSVLYLGLLQLKPGQTGLFIASTPTATVLLYKWQKSVLHSFTSRGVSCLISL